MNPRWQDVGCASVPVRDLPVLADLRRIPGIRVSVVGDCAWVCWESELESERQALIERLLPLAGAEMFARRGGHWYRPGEHLPAFGVPIGDGSGGVPLEHLVLPRPMTTTRPSGAPPRPIALQLMHDERGRPRPSSALRCSLDRLAQWSEHGTSARIASLTGAWISDPAGRPGDAEVLVLGEPGTLPLMPGGSRFWGTDLLIPLGFRADPDLSESALRSALEAGPDDLAVLDSQGPELIPRGAFQPLSRAGIRLALAGGASVHPRGGCRP